MKFKQLNESININRFVSNVSDRCSVSFYGQFKDLSLENFAEDEGGTKALEEVQHLFEKVLDGEQPISSVARDLSRHCKEAESRILREKDEFKRDSLVGYIKVLKAVLVNGRVDVGFNQV